MVKGSVTFVAAIQGNGLTFPLCTFAATEVGVSQVEIEAPAEGNEIRLAVHFASVASEADATALARKASMVILNRLAFRYSIVIETPRVIGQQFSPLHSQPGVVSPSTGSYAFTGSASSWASLRTA